MGRVNVLILKISLGIFVATNLFTLIGTTNPKVLIPLNMAVFIICLGMLIFMESKVSGLARDYKITKRQARRLVSEYFDYYKNIEKISIDEYIEKISNQGDDE